MEHAGYGRPDFAVLFSGRALLHICGPSVSLAFSASVFSPPHFLQFCTLIACVHQNFNKKSETIIEHMGRWIFVKPVNCVARRPDWSHQYYPARKCRGKCRAKKKGGNTNTDSLFENTEGRLKTASRDFCFPSASQIIIKSSFFFCVFSGLVCLCKQQSEASIKNWRVLSGFGHVRCMQTSLFARWFSIWNVLLSVWFTAKKNTKQCSRWTPTLLLGTPQPTTSAGSGWPYNSCYNICLNEKVWSLLRTKWCVCEGKLGHKSVLCKNRKPHFYLVCWDFLTTCYTVRHRRFQTIHRRSGF